MVAEWGVFEDSEYIEGPYYGSLGRTAAAASAKVHSQEDGAEAMSTRSRNSARTTKGKPRTPAKSAPPITTKAN